MVYLKPHCHFGIGSGGHLGAWARGTAQLPAPAPAVTLPAFVWCPDTVWISPNVSLVSPCCAYAGPGGNVLEIKARSVLNAKQPVSKGLVLI